jgi:hypothetical protein
MYPAADTFASTIAHIMPETSGKLMSNGGMQTASFVCSQKEE